MKFPDFLTRSSSQARIPAPLSVPALDSVRVDLRYHRPRSGGDFFDALAVGSSRLVFLLMDIAGKRLPALNLAAFVQDDFRSRARDIFAGPVNEAESLAELCLQLNRTILATAGRAHMTAAFLGSLNEVGALTYINAGHVPALLLAPGSFEFLDSTGLPLGLFTHTTHEASFRVLPPDGALLMASRGVIEARSDAGILECIGRSPEFGIERLLKSATAAPRVARQLSRAVLDSAVFHASRHVDNDMSVAAISREA
jgi:serine phosphatase RsbU (regulator of sigma subunit)